MIEYLNKTKKYGIPADYYDHIQVWLNWWKGFYKPFHEFTEINGTAARKRKLYTLKMAKKVSEDWAAILLNEKTQLVIEDKASSEFIQGPEDLQGTGGVLGENDFWTQGNALVEKAFMSGTGAFVPKIFGAIVEGDRIIGTADGKIHIDYLPAYQILPITVRAGRVIDVAFVSIVKNQGEQFIYLETHELIRGRGYRITNEYFKAVNDAITPAPLPEGIAEVIHTGSDVPLFALFSPNVVNTFDNANGLGLSIYAEAIDNLMGVDLAYNNFCRDFKLGGKKVFYNQDIIQRDANGNAITPDDVMQQLFVQVGEGLIDENGKQNAVQEFNPSLRVAENKDGVQAQLDYLSFKVGFGTKHYQFNGGTIVTATQYTGDKQELIQNAAKHYIAVEKALKDLVKSILWIGKEIFGLPVDPDTRVTVNFEDSYIIDKESERERDRQDVRDGLMQKWEYRVKWYGESEEEAKAMVSTGLTDDELMGFGGGK